MVEMLPGFPGDVLAISASGEVTADDYRRILVPAAKARMKPGTSLKLFVLLGPAFRGMAAGAMWEDAKLGLGNWSKWGRIAIVTDVEWARGAVWMFAPFFHHPMRVFANADQETARAWIVRDEAEAA